MYRIEDNVIRNRIINFDIVIVSVLGNIFAENFVSCERQILPRIEKYYSHVELWHKSVHVEKQNLEWNDLVTE